MTKLGKQLIRGPAHYNYVEPPPRKKQCIPSADVKGFKTSCPPTLKKLCVKAIVENFDALIQRCPDCTEAKSIWRFPYPDCHIASPLAEMILQELGTRKKLRKEHLTLFSMQTADLQSFSLRNIHLTPHSISILNDFTLYNLTVENVDGISLKDITDNLGANTFRELHTLNMRNINFDVETKWSVPSALGAFQNLQWLNIGGTKVDSACLGELVKCLPRLKYLDISKTKVNNIASLKVLKKNLNGLIIHRLPLENDIGFEMTLCVLLELQELRVLDISHYETTASLRFTEIDLFIQSHFAPQLRRLDISGNPFRLTTRDVREFMKNHSNLQCLGFVVEGWNAIEPCEQFPNVDIFGGMGEEQIRKTIMRCFDRPCYLACAFNNISNELKEEDVEEEHFTIDLLEGMPEADLIEVSANPTYVKCLIKNAAEVYLEKSEVLELLVENGGNKLNYLRDFRKYEYTDTSTINCTFQPYIFATIKKLVARNPHACKIALEFGAVEVMTKILQKIKSNDRMANKPEIYNSVFGSGVVDS
ncbi:hypothetical protein ACTXT7_015198 [Hymenolepis weldensis]